MLSELQLKCKNEAGGCTAVLSYGKLETHEERECQFEMAICPNKPDGCNEKLLKSALEKHVKEQCQYTKIECMYCQEKFFRKDIRDHLMNCDEALLTCQHCKGQFPKKIFHIHQSSQCEENYMQCGRCQANFKRKYKDFHDCVRHLLNNQKTMQEQIKLLKKEMETRETKHNTKLDEMGAAFAQELNLIK